MAAGKSAKAQPFGEHIKELRHRVLMVVMALIFGSMIGYFFHEHLFSILRKPLHAQLYYTTPTGGFNAIIKISLMFGVVVAIPVLIYQLGKFLSPAFKHRIKIFKVIITSSILAVLGVLFAYYLSLPASLHFLSNIDPGNLKPLITINEYLGFVFAYVTAFALLFQLPLILLFINRIKPQRPGRLMKFQRWVILVSFILAAILTPTPDPMNQTIMALPIILLYQVSVIMIWFANLHPRNRARLAQQAVAENADNPPPNPPPDDSKPTMHPVPSLTTYKAAAFRGAKPFPSPMPLASSTAKSTEPQLLMDIFQTA